MEEQANIFPQIQEFFRQNGTILLIGTVVLSLTLGGYWFYDYRKTIRSEAAYSAYLELKDMIGAEVAADGEEKDGKPWSGFKTEEDKWTKVKELASKYGYEYSGYGMSGFFPVVESNALLKLGKFEEALEVMSRSVASADNNFVRENLAMRLAMMKIDSSNHDKHEEGVCELEKLAYNGEFVADAAYYRLGEYHWINDRIQDARNFLNTLVSTHSSRKEFGDESVSPWVEKAKEILETIQ